MGATLESHRMSVSSEISEPVVREVSILCATGNWGVVWPTVSNHKTIDATYHLEARYETPFVNFGLYPTSFEKLDGNIHVSTSQVLSDTFTQAIYSRTTCNTTIKEIKYSAIES